MSWMLCLLAFFAAAWNAKPQSFAERAPASRPRDLLALHNKLRARLHLPPLAWSTHLAARSESWAKTLIARNQFRHTPNSTYGENLFEISGAPASPSFVFKSWADESANYDYSSNTCTGGVCGHYTQLVWRDTRAVGCAVARKSTREVWVCTYDPPGNWVGRRPY